MTLKQVEALHSKRLTAEGVWQWEALGMSVYTTSDTEEARRDAINVLQWKLKQKAGVKS